MMGDYFFLQVKMAGRKLREMGINPVAGFVFSVIGFVLISEYLFQKSEFAKYLLVFISFSILIRASETNRTEFLTTIFGNMESRKIRIVENFLICVPFLVSLLFHKAFFEALGLFIGSAIFASFSIKSRFNFTVPTPFYRQPFEFIVGFRNTFYLFPLFYALTFVAVSVQNLNLGIFSMLIIFVISITYYAKAEHEYFVWNFATNSAKFLFQKLLIASKFSILLALPIAGILMAFYPTEIGIILLFLLVGMTFLWTVILAKYSVYPNEISLLEVILIGISVLFPPLLLFLLPYFYVKSIKTLKLILK